MLVPPDLHQDLARPLNLCFLACTFGMVADTAKKRTEPMGCVCISRSLQSRRAALAEPSTIKSGPAD